MKNPEQQQPEVKKMLSETDFEHFINDSIHVHKEAMAKLQALMNKARYGKAKNMIVTYWAVNHPQYGIILTVELKEKKIGYNIERKK